MMSKSLRTRQRYAESFKNQTQLDRFFDARPSTSMIPQVRRVSDRSISSAEESEQSVEFIDVIPKSTVLGFPGTAIA